MTADQGGKDIPDDLLSSDTYHVLQPPPTVEPFVQEKPSHALDQHGQVLHNTSTTTWVPNLESTGEIQDSSIQEGKESGNILDLVQPPSLTVSMEANRLNTAEGADAATRNCDLSVVAQDGNISGLFLQTGQTVLKDEDITVGFQLASNPTSEICYVSEMQYTENTVSASFPVIPEHCGNDPENVAQNSIENSLNLISANQETKVLENSQQGENITTTFLNKTSSLPSQDQSSSGYLNRVSSKVDNIPDAYLDVDWISETPQDVLAGTDSVDKGETVCNTDTEIGDILFTEPEKSGIVGEPICNTGPKNSGLAQDIVCHTDSDSETSDSAKKPTCRIEPKVKDIVGGMFSYTTDGMYESSRETLSNNAGETCQKEPILTRLNTTTKSEETVCPTNTGIRDMKSETTSNVNSEINRIIAGRHSEATSNIGSDSSLECNDRTLVLDQAMSNPNGMSGDNLVDSAANLLDDSSTQALQNLATESRPDMVTSESCLLEGRVPDRISHCSTLTVHQLESMDSRLNDPVVDNMTENISDTHLLIPGFLNTTMEPPQISETDLEVPDLCHTPVIGQHLDSSCRGMMGDCSDMTEARYINDLSNELWMDAYQFLPLEEDKGSIFDEWGHSPTPSPPTGSPDNTKPLAVIGQLVGDWELPLVERWSSSDSWASALSDWFQSVSVFPEDSPPIASTSYRDPTEPQPSMAVKDTIEEPKDSLESSSTTKQMCLPFMSTEEDAQDRKVPKDDNSKEPELQAADKDMHLYNQLYSAGTQDLPEDSVGTQKEKNMETTNLSGSSMPSLEPHLQEEMVGALLPVKECTEGKLAKQHISVSKLESVEIQKVTEDRTSRLSQDYEVESIRNYGPLKFSGYPSDKDPTAGCVSGLDTDSPQPPSFLSPSHTLCHTKGNCSHECFHTHDPETTQEQGRGVDPGFIMPFAPISIGTSFHHSCGLKDQIHVKTSKVSPIGITGAITVETGNFGKPSGEESSDNRFHTCLEKSCTQNSSSPCGDSGEPSSQEGKNKTETQTASDISHELSKLILLTGQQFMVSEEKRVAYVTLDLDDVLDFNKDTSVVCDQGVPSGLKQQNCEEQPHIKVAEMPQKTTKATSEGKAQGKGKAKHKEKMSQQLGTSTKKQEKVGIGVENKPLGSEDGTVTVIETIVITEKVTAKPQGKKKKKHGMPKPESESLSEVGNGVRPKAPKAKSEGDETTLTPASVKVKEKPVLPLMSTINKVNTVSQHKAKQYEEAEAMKAKATKVGKASYSQDSQSAAPSNMLDDDLIKRRRISEETTKTVQVRTRPQLPAIFRQKKEEEMVFKRAYSDVVKQKTEPPKEVAVPHVLAEIQAAPVPDDLQSISLWCQFRPVAADSSIIWTKEGKVLSEVKRGVGDDSRVTLSILKACSKDLGMYCCRLTSSFGSVSTREYHLTSEVLMELVIPSHDTPECREVDGEEEDVHCAPLLFRDNILTDQYFGENQPASIVTEKAHFGEGMHRKAFRTTLRAGMVPVFSPGHPCVLKVHNAISYGTKNNEELIQRNYNLAVEECHVQNTAREYIKAYMNAAKSTESFGEVPEIIPIYLVHRPSSDIPYATLEEELIGDFVKYSVKDGKEINLMRRDSEAGQKCCAFQHWVYSQTDGNLLVTDMQGVGMKLTDVGIATCKKGYKGFKGNCSTSFIDQFKALHQCNRFCEILGLLSLQPKPKRTVAPPKPKAQPVPKKKTFAPVLKGKS